MAIDINSQEFANAWRLVSEALLQFIQSGGQISDLNKLGNQIADVSAPMEQPTSASQANTIQPSVATNQVTKSKIDDRYAARPVRQQDGSYILKNLKDERQPESTFKITRYSDGTCDIELCDLQGEARQIFKDTKSERMPAAVGTIIGDITADKRIVNTKPGKGIIDGRSVRITEPLEVEFQ